MDAPQKILNNMETDSYTYRGATRTNENGDLENYIEGWADVIGYEGQYRISTFGRVMSMGRTVRFGDTGQTRELPEIEMVQMQHYKGHLYVYLSKNNIRQKFFIHRLVAVAFIPNPENKPLVDHKDEEKTNNKIWNLQWMTVQENTQKHYDAIQKSNAEF